jgi:hypothetical protein
MVGLPTVEGLHRMEGLGPRMGGLHTVIGLGPRMEGLPTVEGLPTMGGLPWESPIRIELGSSSYYGCVQRYTYGCNLGLERVTVCCGFPTTINHDLAQQLSGLSQ